eukprot:gene5770-2482_t
MPELVPEQWQRDTTTANTPPISSPELNGNCLFAAVAHQLSDDTTDHWDIRQETVGYMRANPDEFACFVDDDEDGGFESYLCDMEQESVWGGHLELNAISKRYGVNVIVHGLGEPRRELYHESDKVIQLAYVDEIHYTSVEFTQAGNRDLFQQQWLAVRDLKRKKEFE